MVFRVVIVTPRDRSKQAIAGILQVVQGFAHVLRPTVNGKKRMQTQSSGLSTRPQSAWFVR